MGNSKSSAKKVVIEIRPVESLSVRVDPKNSTVALSWAPPTYSNVEVTGYEVNFGGGAGKMRTIDGASNTTLTLSVPTDVDAFVQTPFHVRALSGAHTGEWSSRTVYIACECILSGCHGNKVKKLDGTLFPYCGRQHARETAFKYCMLPGCGAVKDDAENLLGMYQFFCSRKHTSDAAQQEFLTLVELKSQSLDFKQLARRFQSCWKRAKGPCPTVHVVVAIVNPHFSKRLEDYVATLPPSYREIEQYFHGTSLTCHMGENEYICLCNEPNCGACGISRNNFQASRIRTNNWQRYGHGFYLAPDSSKSNDYAHTTGKYKAMFVCDVAPGNKYNFLFNHSDLRGPPQGYHSVYGRFGDGLGTLNYEEIVIFNPHAICPRYILLYM